MLNKLEIAKFIRDSIETLQSSDMTCCKYDLDNNLAIYVGWSSGYDEDDDTVIHASDNPSYAINVGIKVRNDFDWSDFDMLNFPYYENGEVLAAALSIPNNPDYDGINDAAWLIETYEEMYQEVEDGVLILG